MTRGPHRTRRLVLRDCPAEKRVRQYINSNGWPERPTGDDEREPVSARQLTWEIGPDLHLHYVEDSFSSNCYVFATGTSPQAAEDASEQARRELDPWTLDKLVAAVGEADDLEARARTILRLGIAAPAMVDTTVYQVLNRELHSPEDPIRQVALWSITYSPWPAYLPTLRKLADDDPNESIRERARMILDGLDAVGGTS